MMDNDHLMFLMSATANGDREAFGELYELTSSQLYPISLRLLKRQELAEEALQEAYVRIWHNAGNYQSSLGSVLSWMISIVRYRALDMIRYQNVRKEDYLDDDYEDVSTESSQFRDDKNMQFSIDRCMGELDLNQRQAIHLAYFNGLTHTEIMAHMSSALGTVKSWIRRGLVSLERCLSA